MLVSAKIPESAVSLIATSLYPADKNCNTDSSGYLKVKAIKFIKLPNINNNNQQAILLLHFHSSKESKYRNEMNKFNKWKE